MHDDAASTILRESQLTAAERDHSLAPPDPLLAPALVRLPRAEIERQRALAAAEDAALFARLRG